MLFQFDLPLTVVLGDLIENSLGRSRDQGRNTGDILFLGFSEAALHLFGRYADPAVRRRQRDATATAETLQVEFSAVFRRKSAFAESGQITADSRLQFADRLCRILYARALRGMHNRSDTGPDGRCSDNRSLCPALALPRRKAAVEFREAERAIHFRP